MPRGTLDVVGRDGERAALAAFLDDLRAWPAGMVLVGEAGAGKTTVWREGVDRAEARGHRVLLARPAAAEALLAFAGLRDLLAEVFDEVVDALPAPQARALEVALLRRDATDGVTERTAVAAGLLTTLRHLARDQPVVVALDDAQWLDAPSAAALTFVLRRCAHESLALVATRRGGTIGHLDLSAVFGGRGVRDLVIGPMDRADLEEMVRSRSALGRAAVRRVSKAAAGNPFFALEIAQLLGAQDDAAADALPLPPAVGALLASRLVRLSPATRLVLGGAALSAEPTVALLGQVVMSGDVVEPLREAQAAGLVTLSPQAGDRRVRFLHPLLADAIAAELDDEQRILLHRRLAIAAATQEERARHLAAATATFDEGVAETVEAAAIGARRRGAPEIGAQLAMAADRLTPPSEQEASQRRTLLAGDLSFAAGEPDQARRLLERATAGDSAELAAEAAVRLGRVLMFEGDLAGAVARFEQVLERGDASAVVAAEGHEGAAWSYVLRWQDIHAAHRHAIAAVRAAEDAASTSWRSQALAASGVTGLLLGRSGAATAMRRSLAEAEAVELGRVMQHPDFARAVFLAWADRHDESVAAFTSLADRASDIGDEVSRPRLLFGLSYAAWQQGRWAEAGELAAEAARGARLADQQPRFGLLLFSEAVVDAHLGRPVPSEIGPGELGAMIGRLARGAAALGRDDSATAEAELGPLVAQLEGAGVMEPGALRSAPDEIEALIRLDRLDAAEIQLHRHVHRARASRRPVALASARRSQALLHAARGDLDAALQAADASLAAGSTPLPPFERGRALLVGGAVARRAKQKRVARERLEEAQQIFAGLGATGWLERAGDDLARIGGRTTSRGLTVTELRVAQLVADGMSNREVAAALFVSEKTVEATVSRVLAKLAIRSRAGLARRLEDLPPAGVPR